MYSKTVYLISTAKTTTDFEAASAILHEDVVNATWTTKQKNKIK